MAYLVSHPDEVKVVSKRFGLGATNLDRYLELDGYKALQKAISMGPDAIINAAYRQADWATTADGGMHVAAAAAAVGARLVHVSSDAVFSGLAGRYDETCSPDPATPYGAAKAAAETAVKGLDPAAVIARTSLIIGNGDSPHEALVRSLALEGAPY